MNIYDELKTIINNDKPEKPIVCEDDDMFYFAVGQLGRYLIGLSKAEKVNYSFLDPILKAKNSTKIKRELISLIKKYSYEIEVWNKQYRSRFDNLQAFVNSYEIGSDENKTDLILAGFASPNLIYSKKEESE
jgi:CRISPR-associated protein Cas8b/Csh1 subtype I-B